MDPSIAIFILGSCVSFIGFYWVFNRYFAVSRARQRAARVRHYGLEKSSFLDDLRHEAGLRAHTMLCVAADRLGNATWGQATASVDIKMMERLQETRSMLQSLLPRQLTNEFDQIVHLLRSRPSARDVELNEALERFARQVADVAPVSRRVQSMPPAVKGLARRKMSSLQMASDPT